MRATQLTPGVGVRTTEFPSLQGIYLNAASYGPLPARTMAAVREFDDRRAAAALAPEDFSGTLTRAREAAATLIGVDAATITLTPNTSVGLNIAARIAAARARPDRRTVVIPDREFPANVYPWLALQRRGVLDIEIVPCDAAGLPDEAALMRRVQSGDVVALSISAVQFASGYRADLEALGETCARHDVMFVVDAIQALGAVPVDPVAARIGVLAAGAQKWLCSPHGTGFARVAPELLTQHEPELPGWLSFEATADFEQLLSYDYDLWPDGRRFEVGSLGIQSFLGMAHSLELINEVGVDAIFEHASTLLRRLQEGTAGMEADAVVAGSAHASCIAAVPVHNPARVHAALTEAGVTCVPREGAVRLSPHFYNTIEEIDSVIEILQAALP